MSQCIEPGCHWPPAQGFPRCEFHIIDRLNRSGGKEGLQAQGETLRVIVACATRTCFNAALEPSTRCMECG